MFLQPKWSLTSKSAQYDYSSCRSLGTNKHTDRQLFYFFNIEIIQIVIWRLFFLQKCYHVSNAMIISWRWTSTSDAYYCSALKFMYKINSCISVFFGFPANVCLQPFAQTDRQIDLITSFCSRERIHLIKNSCHSKSIWIDYTSNYLSIYLSRSHGPSWN